MNLEKLNSWNWFKHQEGNTSSTQQIPIKRVAHEREISSRYLESYHYLTPWMILKNFSIENR